MPEIAVIIPTYNRTALLQRAIESVQRQTYRNVEIVVVNDGFESAVAALARTHPNCRYIGIEHTGLPAVARNAGARVADSKYLAFLDSDDEWLPEKLETQITALRRSSCGLVCSNAFLVGDPEQPDAKYLKVDQGATGKVLPRLLSDNFVITSTVALDRELFDRSGGFCEDAHLRGMEDYDLWLRLAQVTDFCYLPEALAIYRRSTDSLSGQTSEPCHWRTMSAIFARAAASIDKGDRASNATVRRQADACRRALCDCYLRQGKLGLFAKSFGEFCLHRPVAAAKYVAAKAVKRTA